MINRFKKFLTRNDTKIVLLLAILISVAASAYVYLHGQTLLYIDSRSHLDIARRVTDDLVPSVAQLGSVWLPLFHILELPFISSDFLWTTGLAGTIVSSSAFVFCTYFIYKLVKQLSGNRIVGFFSFLAFSLNPNLLYMQSIPMTEVLTLATTTISIYFFYKWLRNKSVGALSISAFFVFLATWTRYDGWFLAGTETLIILLWAIFNHKKGALGKSIIFAYIGFFGIVVWLIWNIILNGNPLYFLYGEYGEAAAKFGFAEIAKLPSKFNLISSIQTYFLASGLNAGFIPFIISLIFLPVYFLKNKLTSASIVLGLLLSIMLFNIISLFIGTSVIYIPEIHKGFSLWNIRFGLSALPFVSIVPFLVFPKKIFVNFVILVLFMGSSFYLLFSNNVITYVEATVGSSKILSRDLIMSEWFRNNYDGGLIWAATGSRDAEMHEAQIPLKNYVWEGTEKYWKATAKNPSKVVKWIMVLDGDSIDIATKNTSKLNKFLLVYQTPDTRIYRLADELGQQKFGNSYLPQGYDQ